MSSEPRDTILIRVKRATKWAARRAAKADKLTMTEYIIRLIHIDQASRNHDGTKP